MKRNLLYTGGITGAIKAKELLRSYGYAVYVEKLSSDYNSGGGCSYGVYSANCNRIQAEWILSRNNAGNGLYRS